MARTRKMGMCMLMMYMHARRANWCIHYINMHVQQVAMGILGNKFSVGTLMMHAEEC